MKSQSRIFDFKTKHYDGFLFYNVTCSPLLFAPSHNIPKCLTEENKEKNQTTNVFCYITPPYISGCVLFLLTRFFFLLLFFLTFTRVAQCVCLFYAL